MTDNRSVGIRPAVPARSDPIESALRPEETAKQGLTASSVSNEPVPAPPESPVETSPKESKTAENWIESDETVTSLAERDAMYRSKQLLADKRQVNVVSAAQNDENNPFAGWWWGNTPRIEPILTKALLALWLGGALLAFGVQIRRIVRFHRAVVESALASNDLTCRVRQMAGELGTQVPVVRVMPGLSSPVIWGFGKPTLLWPAEDATKCLRSVERTDGIIIHELAHLRRRDHWLAWFEIFAISFLWWHPLAHVACRRLHEYADLSCDSWVVSMLPGHRRRYAASIVDLIEKLSTTPRAALALGVGTSSRRALVERRLLMIVKERTSCRLSPATAFAALLGAAILVPSWAGGALERLAPPSEVVVDSAIAPELRDTVKQVVLKRRANAYFESEDWKAATSTYRALVELDSSNGSALHRLSYSLIALGQLDEAREVIDDQIASGYEPGIAHYNMACVLARQGERAGAFKALARSLNYGFDDVELLSSDPDLESLREDREFRGTVGDVALAHSLSNQANEAVGDEEWESAVVHFSKLAELTPKAGNTQHMLAYSSILASRDAESDSAKEAHLSRARKALDSQIDLGYLPGVAHYNIACVDAIQGRVDSGLKHLAASMDMGFNDLELLTSDPDLDGLRSNARFDELVSRAEQMTEAKEAIADALDDDDFERALALISESGSKSNEAHNVYWAMGYAGFANGDLDQAEEAFTNALLEGHKPSDGLYNLACVESMRGNTNAALAYLNASVDAGWSDAEHMAQDSDLSALHGDSRFEAIRNRAADAGVLSSFGAVDWDHLLRKAERAIADEPDNGVGYHHMGWALLRLGRDADAIKAFKQQRTLGYAPSIAAYNIACGHAKLGQTDEAIAMLAELADAYRGGILTAEFMSSDPDLANIRSDARFKEVVARFAAHESGHDHDHADKHDSHAEADVKDKPMR